MLAGRTRALHGWVNRGLLARSFSFRGAAMLLQPALGFTLLAAQATHPTTLGHRALRNIMAMLRISNDQYPGLRVQVSGFMLRFTHPQQGSASSRIPQQD